MAELTARSYLRKAFAAVATTFALGAVAHPGMDHAGHNHKPISPTAETQNFPPIILDAQKNSAALLKLAKTKYSEELEQLEERYQKIISDLDDIDPNTKIIILDPEQFYASIALGFAPVDYIKRTLEKNNVLIDDKIQIALAEYIQSSHKSNILDLAVQSISPAAYNHKGSNGETSACIVIPATNTNIIGFSEMPMNTNERKLYANNHELWHCLGKKYKDINYDEEEIKRILQFKSPLDQVQSHEYLEFISNINKKEVFADLGGLSALIEDGADIDILDRAIAFRSAQTYATSETGLNDIDHSSTMALIALKDHIQKIGIDEFRKLKPAELQKLYYKITDEHALSPADILHMTQYESGNIAAKIITKITARFDNKAKRAINTNYTTKNLSLNIRTFSPKVTVTKNNINEVKNWNIRADLLKYALELKGEITPASLTEAHTKLQNYFYDEKAKDPSNAIFDEAASKLRDFFTFIVTELDYEAINKAAKVDFNKSPTLNMYYGDNKLHKISEHQGIAGLLKESQRVQDEIAAKKPPSPKTP